MDLIHAKQNKTHSLVAMDKVKKNLAKKARHCVCVSDNRQNEIIRPGKIQTMMMVHGDMKEKNSEKQNKAGN